MTKFLTPNQKQAQLESMDGNEAKPYLDKIQTAIYNSTRMHITYSLQSVPVSVIGIIIKKLSENGWIGQVVQDDRDGDYLDIRPR